MLAKPCGRDAGRAPTLWKGNRGPSGMGLSKSRPLFSNGTRCRGREERGDGGAAPKRRRLSRRGAQLAPSWIPGSKNTLRPTSTRSPQMMTGVQAREYSCSLPEGARSATQGPSRCSVSPRAGPLHPRSVQQVRGGRAPRSDMQPGALKSSRCGPIAPNRALPEVVFQATGRQDPA